MSYTLALSSTVLFILVLWSVSGEWPSLKINPKSKSVKVMEGFVAKVDFTYTGRPDPTFYVHFDGTLSGVERFIFTGKTLTIKHVRKTDGGKYWIYTEEGAGKGISADSFLLVVEKGGLPKLVETYSKIQKVHSGGRVRFKCKPEAGRRRQVTWYRNSSLLNPYARNPRIIFKRYMLEIKNVTTSDDGKYECKIHSSYIGYRSFEYRLQVYRERKQNRAPGWLPCTIDAISRDFGDSVTFTCNATGLPTPIIRWQKDGRRFHRNSNREYTITHGKLVIPQLVMDDAGTYTCNVTNGRGFITFAYHLTVKPREP